ncbi:MAG: hypothetical protein RLZZ423_1681 [Cyanobacteriota bacterium]|jgi:hypothetical protein
MTRSTHLGRAGLALAGALLLGSGSGWSQSTPAGRADRPAKDQGMLDALARLTPAQRSAYIQELRRLEENRSRQQLAQLDQVQRCLAQASSAPTIRSCWQAMAQGRHQWRNQQMQQRQALAQRFGLPAPRRSWGQHPGAEG